MPVSGIAIKNCWLNAKAGAELTDASGILFDNIWFNTAARDAVIKLDNVTGFRVAGLGYLAGKEKVLKLAGSRTKDIDLRQAGLPITARNTEIAGDVPKDALLLEK